MQIHCSNSHYQHGVRSVLTPMLPLISCDFGYHGFDRRRRGYLSYLRLITEPHHTEVHVPSNTRLNNKALPRFGELYSCCCLPLLPHLDCSIIATWERSYGRALYILWSAKITNLTSCHSPQHPHLIVSMAIFTSKPSAISDQINHLIHLKDVLVLLYIFPCPLLSCSYTCVHFTQRGGRRGESAAQVGFQELILRTLSSGS